MNEGTAKALSNKKSLFAAGIVGVKGDFAEMSCVSICVLWVMML